MELSLVLDFFYFVKNEVGHEAKLTLYVLVLVRREIDLLVYNTTVLTYSS